MIFFHKILCMEIKALEYHTLHFIFYQLQDFKRAEKIQELLPKITHALPDSRSLFKKWIVSPVIDVIKSAALFHMDKNYQAIDQAFTKLNTLKKKIIILYTTELKLRKEEAEFVKVMGFLSNDLENSSMISDDDMELTENNSESQHSKIPEEAALNESILSVDLEKTIRDMEFVLQNGERIDLYDLMRVRFLINTCLKDMLKIKKRMLNPSYKQDQLFTHYFNWYKRLIKNIRRLCREILNRNPKKTVIGG